MKFYSEEQVRSMLQVCEDRDLYDEILTFDDVLKTQTPIELPNDLMCVNCDEPKSTHSICMDCIIEVGMQNIATNQKAKNGNQVTSNQYKKYIT